MIDKHKLESFSFAGLFVLVFVLVFLLFKPFFQILILATAFAIIFHSPYEKLTRFLGQKPNVSALIVVLTSVIFFIIPLFLLGMQIFQETQSLYYNMSNNATNYLQAINQAVEIPIQHILPDFSFNADDYIINILRFISNNLGIFISQALYILFETFLMLLASFFFLRDGRKMLASFVKTSPFGEEHTNQFLDKTYKTINSIVKGTFFITIIRWVSVSIAFYIFGIPNALLWGSVAGLIGAIPGIGTPFAIIPVVGYLYFSGHFLAATGLVVLGVGIVILVDNFMSVYFFGKSFEVPSIFVLFSILGGIVMFGPLGFILGPIILSLFLSVVHTYSVLKG